ncbi:MAG: hypothetical protein IJT94_13995, partial [Oscillibacter sp.]|nr:hypothetical protein [Oscillibacter sp.]
MIDIYINEIRQALKHQCYFPALALALALPDICGMAEFPHLRVTERYIAWYDKYLGQAMVRDGGAPYLSGEVVYNLRNT